MPPLRQLLLALVLLLPNSPALSIVSATQQTAPPDRHQSQAPGTFNVTVVVDSVFLNVTVQDRYTGQNIRDLRREDFAVYEDDWPQEIRQFAAAEAPLEVLLLLDNSGSTHTYLHLIKAASLDFIRRMKAIDPVAVATFNYSAALLQDFTVDRAATEKTITAIKPEGGTALYDALLTCLSYYMPRTRTRKAIVLFTDGVDNQLEGPNSEGSTTPFAVVYRRIQEVDSSVYAVFLEPKIPQRSSGQKPSRDIRAISPGIGWPTSRPEPPPRPSSSTVCEMARDQLQRIATQTGGRMRSLTRVEDIGHVYAEIAEELQYQYQLGYNPTNTEHDGKWRQIHVEVRNRPDVSIRTRRGYYVSGPELR